MSRFGKLGCMVFLLLLLSMAPWRIVFARPASSSRAQGVQPTPGELINAVNALRQTHGLAALKQNSILMTSAQSQANALLGSEGAVGHSRPAGMTFTEQLIQLGYPLAGDLSLGGIRSENFVFGTELSILDAIQFWLGDEPHTNTMLADKYVDIGAGVAVGSDGNIYYVIDTARPTSSGLPQYNAGSVLTVTVESQSELLSQYILPVARSTARPDGIVFHQVQYGQSLWGIAIAYGTTINSLRALNNLGDSTTVYEGQVLVVQKGATQPAPPAATATTPASATPTATLPATATALASASPDPSATPAAAAGDGSMLGVALGILIFGLAFSAAIVALSMRDRAA